MSEPGPNDAAPHSQGESLDHVMKNLFDGELERIAFSRPQNDDERRRASAAGRELARRLADHARRSGEAASPLELGTAPTLRPTPLPSLRPIDRARGAAAPTVGRPDAAPRWRRTAGLLGAGILAVIVVVSIVPALPTEVDGASSLDVFAREETPEELALRQQLEREGLRLSVAPRIIAEREGAQILAYRVIVSSGAERPRNEVCLLLNQERALGSPLCTERVNFLRDGLLASLAGAAATYVVRWGPSGTPDVSVLPQNQIALVVPESAAAEAMLAGEQTAADLTYSRLLRELHPDDRLIVRVLSTTPGWDAVGALIASADTGQWSYCVHLFARADDARSQLGASVTCAGREPFERDGLVAQARTDDSTVTVEWLPDDTVHIDTVHIDTVHVDTASVDERGTP